MGSSPAVVMGTKHGASFCCPLASDTASSMYLAVLSLFWWKITFPFLNFRKFNYRYTYIFQMPIE